jgi:hypothetical protein
MKENKKSIDKNNEMKRAIPEESLEETEIFEGGLNQEQLRENNVFLLFDKKNESNEEKKSQSEENKLEETLIMENLPKREGNLKKAKDFSQTMDNIYEDLDKTFDQIEMEIEEEEKQNILKDLNTTTKDDKKEINEKKVVKAENNEKKILTKEVKTRNPRFVKRDTLIRNIDMMTSQLSICLQEVNEIEPSMESNIESQQILSKEEQNESIQTSKKLYFN